MGIAKRRSKPQHPAILARSVAYKMARSIPVITFIKPLSIFYQTI